MDLLSNRALVIGNSEYGLKVASEIVSIGVPVTLISRRPLVSPGPVEGSVPIEFFSPATLVDFQGTTGRFEAVVELNDGNRITREVGSTVVALESDQRADFDKWGLERKNNILSLEDMVSLLSTNDLALGQDGKVCFISQFNGQSNAVCQARLVRVARDLRRHVNCQVFVLTEHFKVAEAGLERELREARDSGIVFVKMVDQRPRVTVEGDRLLISYYDEAFCSEIELGVDMLVLEDSIYPPNYAAEISRILDIELDTSGFFQGDFVHNFPIFTSRNGIYVVGSCKGPIGKDRALSEAKAVALEVAKLLELFDTEDLKPTIYWDSDKCASCLTCYRVCPHRAIVFSDGKPMFYPLACRSCGICVAFCPMNAIDLIEDEKCGDELRWRLRPRLEEPLPELVIFACQNSGYQAYELARRMGFVAEGDFQIFKVPCAGSIDHESIASAFAYGAKTVIIAACPHDSCKSIEGSRFSEGRSRVVNGLLSELGLGEERLVFVTLASGMAKEFAGLINKAAVKAWI